MGAWDGLGVAPPVSLVASGGAPCITGSAAMAPWRDCEELSALSQTLPGLRFFRRRLGCRCSPLAGGDLEKKLDNLRSLVGVTTAGGGGGETEGGGASRGGCAVSAIVVGGAPARLGTGPWVAE